MTIQVLRGKSLNVKHLNETDLHNQPRHSDVTLPNTFLPFPAEQAALGRNF
ncbi:hypothetical protein AKO1_001669 [Acrasis kona]|uniref:Uncharacterized protein n=1 Tax=Acrasis kona TaxID=1008807 RepID=A0AAW2YS70_9EUKA